MEEYIYAQQLIRATGGYSMEQHFGEIPYLGTTGTDLTQLYDLTHTLQVDFDVRIFNEKLGIYKDETNENIIDDTNTSIYDGSKTDRVSLTTEEFIDNISADQIVSLGKYTSLYSDFNRITNTYFGYADGFASIYDESGAADINSGVFTPSNLIDILSEKYYDISQNYTYKLNGNIQINELTNILTFLYEKNPFDNRSDETREYGFVAGDRILVSSGITISLDLTIYNADYIENPLYNNSTLLKHTVNAPLLLTLQNLS